MTGGRRTTCRYLKTHVQCTAEAVDPEGEVLLCAEHLAAVLRLIQQAVGRPEPGAPAARPSRQ